MADTSIRFTQPHSGRMREAPIGFSWTTLFFGFLPAVFRGHWTWAIIMLILACFTFGLSGIVMAFIYNGIYARHLIDEGYKASLSAYEQDALSRRINRQIPIA